MIVIEVNGADLAVVDRINIIGAVSAAYNTSTPGLEKLDLTVNPFLAVPPIHSTDPGVAGQMAYDVSYLYLYAGGSWKRIALSGAAF